MARLSFRRVPSESSGRARNSALADDAAQRAAQVVGDGAGDASHGRQPLRFLRLLPEAGVLDGYAQLVSDGGQQIHIRQPERSWCAGDDSQRADYILP